MHTDNKNLKEKYLQLRAPKSVVYHTLGLKYSKLFPEHPVFILFLFIVGTVSETEHHIHSITVLF